MKKILSILSAVGLTATSTSFTVACSSKKTSNNPGDNTPAKTRVNPKASYNDETLKVTGNNLQNLYDIGPWIRGTKQGNVVVDVTTTLEKSKSSPTMLVYDLSKSLISDTYTVTFLTGEGTFVSTFVVY